MPRCRRGRRGGWRRLPREETRDWAGLPGDVLSALFHKLDHVEIMMGAGLVCRSWRRAAEEEPELWRRINMLYHDDLYHKVDLPGMARRAVDRSAGQCEAFWGELVADNDFLIHLSKRAPSLKSLRLIACYYVSTEVLSEVIKKLPLLEELELTHTGHAWGRGSESFSQACPHLKSLTLNNPAWSDIALGYYQEDKDGENDDKEALAIAKMHELRSLQLFGNTMTNVGLTAILDNCPQLESLDIRNCFNVKMDEALRAKCVRIRKLMLPHTTADYDFKDYVDTDPFCDDGFDIENLGFDLEEFLALTDYED